MRMQRQHERLPVAEIDLLPLEIFRRRHTRRVTVGVIAVSLVVLSIIGVIYAFQSMRLNSLETDIAAQEAVNEELNGEISALDDVAQLQAEFETARGLVASLVSDRVLWSGILADIARVVPARAWLTGLTAGVQSNGVSPVSTPAIASADGTATSGLVGQITFNGYAMTHRDVAEWLSRVEDVFGFANPWLSTSTKTEIGTQQVVQFTSSVDLTEEAVAAHQRGGPE